MKDKKFIYAKLEVNKDYGYFIFDDLEIRNGNLGIYNLLSALQYLGKMGWELVFNQQDYYIMKKEI